jgi:probable phosphoglycerate mutase
MIAGRAGATAKVDDDLVEMDVGEMEHLTGTELRARYPDFLDLWMSDGDAVADARMPGGETLREVQGRAWRFIERVAETHARGTVVAVTHNFVILTLVCRALDLPLARFRRMRPVVGSKSVIEMRDGQARLVRFNDVAHLAAAGLTDDPDAEVVR